MMSAQKISVGEKKVILIGSSALLALILLCSVILIAVCKNNASESEPQVKPMPTFPMKYFQADRRNYISHDGEMAVIGPAWEKGRDIGGACRYPVIVMKKNGDDFLEPYILWCEKTEGADTDNFIVRCESIELRDMSGEAELISWDEGNVLNVKLHSVEE